MDQTWLSSFPVVERRAWLGRRDDGTEEPPDFSDPMLLQLHKPRKPQMTLVFVPGFLSEMDEADWNRLQENTPPKHGNLNSWIYQARFLGEHYDADAYLLHWPSGKPRKMLNAVAKALIQVPLFRVNWWVGGAALAYGALRSLFAHWKRIVGQAETAGIRLGNAISRGTDEDVAIIGHSLGARVALRALQNAGALGGTRPRWAVALGTAAAQREFEWDQVDAGVADGATLFHAHDDHVLKWVYRRKLFDRGQPMGLDGFDPIDGLLRIKGRETPMLPGTPGSDVHHRYVENMHAILADTDYW